MFRLKKQRNQNTAGIVTETRMTEWVLVVDVAVYDKMEEKETYCWSKFYSAQSLCERLYRYYDFVKITTKLFFCSFPMLSLSVFNFLIYCWEICKQM